MTGATVIFQSGRALGAIEDEGGAHTRGRRTGGGGGRWNQFRQTVTFSLAASQQGQSTAPR